MTEREAVLYQIMSILYKADVPLVFKGALVVKAILNEHEFNWLERETRDIDANWVNTPPSMDTLVSMTNNAFDGVLNNFKAVAIQEYTEKQSACLQIIEKNTNTPYATIDIKIKPYTNYMVYCVDEVSFKGVMVNEILADKISVLSGNKIFRRAKDFVDVYALSHCVEIRVADIFETCEKEGRVISAFYEFLSRKSDLEHAYNKLQRIQGKPPFNIVYSYMENFLRPFVEQTPDDMIWNSQDCIWEEVERQIKKHSLDR